MVKESTMENKIDFREERELEIARAFDGVSPIRNQAEKGARRQQPDEFLIFGKIERSQT